MKKIPFLFLILLIGCSNNTPLPSGLVTAKVYEPSHTNIILMPMTIQSGNTTTTIMQTYVITEPERWVVTIEPYDKEGKPLEVQKIFVKKEVFDSLQLGTWFQQTEVTQDTTKSTKKKNE